MRAIVQHEYGSPDLLRLEEVDRPTIGDKDVLVRVLASSVNPADLAVVTGLPGLVRTAPGLRRPRQQVPGRDLAGVIEEVEPDLHPAIAGVALRSLTSRQQRLVVVSARPNRGILDLTALIESGAVTPYIERTYPLAEVPDALRHLATYRVRGKLAIDVASAGPGA